MEGLYGDDAEAINMLALQGSNVPDNTWSLPRIYDYDWSQPTYPRNLDLWKTSKTFLTEAQYSSGTNVTEVDVPLRKVDEEVVHCNIQDATASQSAVLYKVFGRMTLIYPVEAIHLKAICQFDSFSWTYSNSIHCLNPVQLYQLYPVGHIRIKIPLLNPNAFIYFDESIQLQPM
jgi:hypothetical protein